MASIKAKIKKLVRRQKIREILVIYILLNLGILFTIYGTVLYTPAMVPDEKDLNPEYAKMELINLTKGALISQNFELSQYNIGFDMLNIGGIFLIIGLLYYNYVESSMKKKNEYKLRLKVYKLREKGHLQGNMLEWLCLIVFLFAFFTFFSNVFVYIIITSFIVGVIGFTIRKIYQGDLLFGSENLSHY